MVESERTKNGKTSTKTRCYRPSFSNDACNFLSGVRTHWGIENSVHWVLDVASMKTTSGRGQATRLRFSRYYAARLLNILKDKENLTGGVVARSKRAGWDQDYLFQVLPQ